MDHGGDLAGELADLLPSSEYAVDRVDNAEEALAVCAALAPGIALLDAGAGERGGLDLIAPLREAEPGLLCVAIVADTEFDGALAAFRKGAFDVVRKPLDPDEVRAVLDRGFETLEGERGQRRGDVGDAARRHVHPMSEAELALRESEERFRDFAETASDWFWEMDENLRFTWFSDRYGRVGLEADERAGKTRLETTADPDTTTPKWRAHLADLEARRPFRDFEHTGWDRDGRLVHMSVSGTPIFDDQGNFKGYRGTAKDISKRKRAEEALRDSEERFRAITEASPVPLVITRRSDGAILYANPKLGETLGLPADQMIGRSLAEFYLDPTSREERLAALDEAGYVRESELEMRRADGTPISTIHSLQAITYRGEPAVLGGFYDVTERKRAQEQADLSQARLADALESAVEGFVLYDADERLVLCDSKYRDFYWQFADLLVPGARLEDMVRASLERGMFDDEGDPEEWIRKRLEQYRSPPNSHIQQLTDGRWIQATEYRTRDGGIFGIRTDITDIVKREDALRDSEERFRAITEASPVPLVITRRSDGAILYANPKVGQVLGLPADRMIGRSLAEFYRDPTSRDVWLAALEEAGYVRESELEMRKADGTPISTIHSLQAITYEGEPAVLGGFYDVTERKAVEDQLRQAQKMEAVGQLTGGIAHDFNNLLTVVLGNLELVVENIAEDQDLRALVEGAESGARRGAELTQRLLAFSREQALEPSAIDVNERVTSMLGLLGRTLGEPITIEVASESALWPAFADTTQVENALLNLAINARDAMPRGGRLSIETANVRVDEGDPEAPAELSPGEYVMLAVTDTGVGMTAAVLGRAFEPFYTTKEVGRGSGLGLSMIYGFAKQSRGHVTIDSAVGRGTTVKLFLPRAKNDRVETHGSARGAVPRGQGETVLVVEDEIEVRDLAAALLENLGYRVVEAGDRPSAIRALEREPQIDLLFTDIVLPHGISGIELAAEVSASRPGIAVLLTSGYPDEAIRRHGELGHDVKLLRKPYPKRDLAHQVRRALDERASPIPTAAPSTRTARAAPCRPEPGELG